jgi:hypothetical protein
MRVAGQNFGDWEEVEIVFKLLFLKIILKLYFFNFIFNISVLK